MKKLIPFKGLDYVKDGDTSLWILYHMLWFSILIVGTPIGFYPIPQMIKSLFK